MHLGSDIVFIRFLRHILFRNNESAQYIKCVWMLTCTCLVLRVVGNDLVMIRVPFGDVPLSHLMASHETSIEKYTAFLCNTGKDVI